MLADNVESWTDQWKQQGLEQGLEQGREAARHLLLRQVRRRFGPATADQSAAARALLRDAPILLLDEPTEGLDAGTERALLDALHVLMAGRTASCNRAGTKLCCAGSATHCCSGSIRRRSPLGSKPHASGLPASAAAPVDPGANVR